MGTGVGRQAGVAGELVEWWEDLWQQGMTSRVVLVAVPAGWGRSTTLDRLEEVVSADDAPVTLVVRVGGRELQDEDVGVQAAGLQHCLAGARARHQIAELLRLDRLGGAAQMGLGVGGLFLSGLAAGVGFLVSGVVIGAAGKAWDDSPAGQDGAVARAARAVAAASVEVPVVVLIDDAGCVDQDLALTMIENLAARHDGHVLVVAAVNPGSRLEKALVSRARKGIIEGLVQIADADPDMGYQSREELAREQCPALPEAAVRRIARRTSTFADVFAVAAAPRLAEIGPGMAESESLAVTDVVISAQLKRPEPSPEAVIIAWAGGVLHARQAARALPILGAEPLLDADGDVLRWEGLERLADRRSPRLAVQVAALATRDKQDMAAALLDEALRIAADPRCGLVDRVVSARAAHRVRAELADRSRLARVQRELAADLEALGEPADALEVAAAALQQWPDGGRSDDHDWLAAAVLRLARGKLPTRLAPLVNDLIVEAVAGGAAVGPEARIWAAIDLLAIEGQREAALDLIDQVAVVLDEHPDFGATGDRWRLLLAFHAGRAGYPAISEHLLIPLLNSGDDGREDAARAVLYACGGPRADTRLQNIILEAELAVLPSEADDDRLRIHQALARNYETLGEYRQALIHGQHELALRQVIQPPDHPDILTTRAQLALWTGRSGDWAKALRLYQDLLPEQERVIGPYHRNTLTSRGNIAYWTGMCGDAAAALRLFQDLLPDRERVLGPDHEDTLTTRSNIAFWTGECGDAAGALRLSKDLLPDRERVLGPDHKETLNSRGNIAFWTGRLGEVAEALRLYRELLPDRERVLGPDHPDTLRNRSNIAYLTGRLGEVAEALRLFQDLLPDQERVLGPDHPDIFTNRDHIARLTGRVGDVAEALSLYRRLLLDRERVLGPDHPDTLRTRNEIAHLTGRLGDAAETLRLFRDLLPDRERVLGPDHEDTLANRSNIAFWTGLLGDTAEALRLFQTLLPDQERVLGPDHPETLRTRNNIAFWTGRLGQVAEALRLFQDLLPDQERVLGPDHPETLGTRNNIAYWVGVIT